MVAVDTVSWADALAAIGSIATPLLVLIFGSLLAYRQNRSQKIQQARLDYYKALAPDLNQLMCYLTFIGTWKDMSPPEVIELKRRLDSNFYVASPLFSPMVQEAYDELMEVSFKTFGAWGTDAKIRSSAFRRRTSWHSATRNWEPEWDTYFELDDQATISKETLNTYRSKYDKMLSALVKDLAISRTRVDYTTARVSLNAGGGRQGDIEGSPMKGAHDN